MRTYFRSLSDVLGSPLAQTAQTFSPPARRRTSGAESTKLEDAAYRDLRRGDNELDALEKACGEKLSTFPALSRGHLSELLFPECAADSQKMPFPSRPAASMHRS